MENICFCIGDVRELGTLIGDIDMMETAQVILDPGMEKPPYLGSHVLVYTNLDPNVPIKEKWNVDLLFATHRSTIGRHLVEHWDRPKVKFLYQGLYAPTEEWLKLHKHLYAVWGLTAACVKGFENLDPWVVNAVEAGEQLGPGPRLLDLMSA